MNKLGLVFAFVGVVGAVACSPKSEAYVECRNMGDKLAAGMSCSIEHRTGNLPLHVCWTLNLGCANGTKGSGEGCGDVEPRGKSTTMLPYAAFHGTLDKCDNVTSSNVTNLKATPR